MFAELTSDALLWLLAMTLIHGTALALLTWAADVSLLRRCRPSVKAALWTVVLVKFLLPPVLPVSYGMSALLGPLGPGAGEVAQGSPQSLTPEHLEGTEAAAASQTAESALLSEAPALLLFSYASLLLFLSSRALLNSRRAGRRLRRLPFAGGELNEEVRRLARRLGLRRAPLVRLDAGAASPYVIGAWRPTLVLPAALPAGMNPAAREALIVHELAHIRRRDVLVRWIQNFARLVFFFWPPVWWLCRRLERFSEMACDQWAIRFSSVSPRLYAESLLEVAKGVREGVSPRHELGFAARRSGALAARFELILDGGHAASPRLSGWASAVLLGWCLFALTGSILAAPERDAPAAVVATQLTSAGPKLGGPADDGDARAPVELVDAAQGGRRASGRVDRPRRGLRATRPAARAHDKGVPAAASDGAVYEKISTLQTGSEKRADPVTSPRDGMNGGRTSPDFEAGFSAGLRYEERRRSRHPAGCDRCGPCSIPCSESERRRETELRERRLRFSGLP